MKRVARTPSPVYHLVSGCCTQRTAAHAPQGRHGGPNSFTLDGSKNGR